MPNEPGHSHCSGVNAASRVAVIRPPASLAMASFSTENRAATGRAGSGCWPTRPTAVMQVGLSSVLVSAASHLPSLIKEHLSCQHAVFNRIYALN